MKPILLAVAILLFGGRMTAQDPAWPPDWSSPSCKCIKNENGKCMFLSRRGWSKGGEAGTGMPRYSRGSGTQNQFLPNCVDDCLPGSTLTTGPDKQTRKELSQCYVDWKRLRKENPQWSDPTVGTDIYFNGIRESYGPAPSGDPIVAPPVFMPPKPKKGKLLGGYDWHHYYNRGYEAALFDQEQMRHVMRQCQIGIDTKLLIKLRDEDFTNPCGLAPDLALHVILSEDAPAQPEKEPAPRAQNISGMCAGNGPDGWLPCPTGGDPDYLRDVPAKEVTQVLTWEMNNCSPNGICEWHESKPTHIGWTCEDKRRIVLESEDGNFHCILPPGAAPQPAEKQQP